MTTNNEAIHTCEIPVRWDEMDSNGHVNNKIYQSYLDEARIQAMTKKGYDFPELRKSNIGPVITKIEIEYKNELKHPDTVIVESKLEFLNKFRACFHQKLIRKSDNLLVCNGKTFWFMMDLSRKRPIEVSYLPKSA
ncbi:MAG: acyl-CoA thioesterase [Leptospiraceae bacterium]|nr:acyl-CoA thioesterase [Leptospiraceae bacterium]MCP5493892.1 acyl-CoA thioesterase [Leptospiraceae bacterium]